MRHAGSTIAFSHGALSTMQVDVSVTIQNLETTASRWDTSMTAIFRTQLSSPVAAGPTGFASEMLCGGAVLMVISIALGEPNTSMQNLPLKLEAVAARARLVVFGSLIAFTAYLYLLAHASPAIATSYAFVNPIIAIFLGAFFAGEPVTEGEWIACGAILTGVILIFRGKSATSRGK